MNRLRSIATILLALISSSIFAQSKEFDNVMDVEVRNTVEITNNKQIVGYAFFYKMDKKRKSDMYRLAILDENLKEIGSNEFEGSKLLQLKNAVYESNRLLLSFFDESEKDGYEKFVKVYDLQGKETGTVPYKPGKVKMSSRSLATAKEMEQFYEGMENVEGKGFVNIHQSEAKTGGIDIQMIGLDGKLVWEKSMSAKKGDRSDIYLLGTTTNTVLLFEMDRGSLRDNDPSIFLVGLKTADGEVLFKKPMAINGLSYEPMLLKKNDDGKLKLVSSISDASDKFLTCKPNGFSVGNLNDQTGEIITLKDFSFLKDMGGVLDMKNENKSEDGYIKPHDILMMPDGGMVLVGEFFRRTVSGSGVALKILSQGAWPAVQATIGDMFLLRINNNMKTTAIEKIEKDKKRYTMPDFVSIGMVLRSLASDHRFAYMYTDEGMNGTDKTIVARGSFGEDTYGTVALSINEKEGYSKKRFNLESEKNVVYHIARAKPGYVMIMKYFLKARKISVNLEKVS